MTYGIKTTPSGDVCGKCNAKVNVGVYNFCPICGNALNFDAIRLNDQQIKKAKLEVLDELSLKIQDAKSLQIILDKVKSL